jgi:hypothetical protein
VTEVASECRIEMCRPKHVKCRLTWRQKSSGWGAVLFGFPIGIAGFLFFVRLSCGLERRTPNLKAFAACAMAAFGLSTGWLEWPFRSATMTLVAWLRTSPSAAGFVFFIVVSLAAFQLILLIRMIPAVDRGGKPAAAAVVAFVLTLVFLAFVAFPKVMVVVTESS